MIIFHKNIDEVPKKLRSRMTLPHNFEHIPLNKPLIERLLGAGIEEDELRAVGVSI